MNTKRPINLDLMTMKFPPMAIASILHRLSGLLLLLLLPYILYLLHQSLISAASFAQLNLFLTQPLAKFGLWLFLSALTYHLLAGIRHLLMDYGIGESLRAGKASAIFVITAAGILMIGIGIWLW